MKKRSKKLPPIVVNNRMKGDWGATTTVGNKAKKIEINLKQNRIHRHGKNSFKDELADTMYHEIQHAKHPKMTEKTDYKKTRKAMKTMSQAEKDKLISKLRMKKLNYKRGAIKRKLKIHRKGAMAPGSLISSARMSPSERVAIMGAV